MALRRVLPDTNVRYPMSLLDVLWPRCLGACEPVRWWVAGYEGGFPAWWWSLWEQLEVRNVAGSEDSEVAYVERGDLDCAESFSYRYY